MTIAVVEKKEGKKKEGIGYSDGSECKNVDSQWKAI